MACRLSVSSARTTSPTVANRSEEPMPSSLIFDAARHSQNRAALIVNIIVSKSTGSPCIHSVVTADIDHTANRARPAAGASNTMPVICSLMHTPIVISTTFENFNRCVWSAW